MRVAGEILYAVEDAIGRDFCQNLFVLPDVLLDPAHSVSMPLSEDN